MRKMVTLTVFTPTYNRAYCLPRGYEALRRQSVKDFKWIIIDDGSTDNTRELVQNWQQADNGFEIQYIYKDNGGLYTGYNAAIAAADTELCVCVDSDDYLTDDAVEKAVSFWRVHGSDQYAGVIGLDCLPSGEVLGDPFPAQKSINLIDLLLGKYPIHNADRKNVVRTDLYKKYAPMKVFPGERDFNPHFLHIQISKTHDFLVLNEKLCVVEYQPGGMSDTILRQYLRSPRSFREMRLMDLSLEGAPFRFYAKKMIHYVASCILAKEACFSASPKKWLTALMYPLGILMVVYLKIKNRG